MCDRDRPTTPEVTCRYLMDIVNNIKVVKVVHETRVVGGQ